MNELDKVSNGLTVGQQVGQAADTVAQAKVLVMYRMEQSENTLRSQYHDLVSFAKYMCSVGIVLDVTELEIKPEAWRLVTFGLVEAFKVWMLQQGYAIASINRKLSTVKVYCNLAYKAGVLDIDTANRIRMVEGTTNRVDENRSVTRISTKKAKTTEVTPAQVSILKQQPATAQGLRDEVLIRLLFDYALRVSEVANLKVGDIDLNSGIMTVNRIKTSTTDRFDLLKTPDTYRKIKLYIETCCYGGQVYLLRGSNKGGKLTDGSMNERNIAKRLDKLGDIAGVENLSAHDARHAWATNAVKKNVNSFTIKEFGGWSSMETVKRYVDKSKVISVNSVYDE